MCGEQMALLRAVCQFPEEDTPRLVYADWLDENDRGIRGFGMRSPNPGETVVCICGKRYEG